MDLKLNNRRAFISGSTAGIGFAIARGLAAEGAAVTVNGRSEDKVAATVARLKREFPDGSVKGIAADVTTAEGAAIVQAALPAVDILINNLGVCEFKNFFETPDEDWMRLFSTNVLSGVRLSRLYAKAMAAQGWGRIIFVSSEAGLGLTPELILYGTTKLAQLAVSRGLAAELAATGVTVNSIVPGPTLTEQVDVMLEDMAAASGTTPKQAEADFMRTQRPSSLTRRFSASEEVASIAVYLCGAQASSTSGAALRVDGGCTNMVF